MGIPDYFSFVRSTKFEAVVTTVNAVGVCNSVYYYGFDFSRLKEFEKSVKVNYFDKFSLSIEGEKKSDEYEELTASQLEKHINKKVVGHDVIFLIVAQKEENNAATLRIPQRFVSRKKRKCGFCGCAFLIFVVAAIIAVIYSFYCL